MLLSDEDRGRYLRAMRNPHADALRKGSMFKKIVDKCKKANTCFGCDAFNGKVTDTHTLTEQGPYEKLL